MQAYAFRSFVWKIYVVTFVVATIMYSEFYLSFSKVRHQAGNPDSLPGWGGAVGRHGSTRKHLLSFENVIPISWKPRVFLFKNFLSHEECDHLIRNSLSRLNRSKVADVDGKPIEDEGRTSYTMFYQKDEDPIISDIEDRISKWTFLNKTFAESIQVSRYQVGQVNERHYDFFMDPENVVQGGHRTATVLMYLNDVEEGGETVFDEAQDKSHSDSNLSKCAKDYLAVKPKKGNALLFYNIRPDGEKDDLSVHYSCPVLKGVKWVAVKWIHLRRYDEPTECEDEHADCEGWAKDGDCESNPDFMKGTFGQCRKSCNDCDSKTD